MSRPVTLYIILALVVLGTIFIRLRLLDLPLERDEGEFALMGQMILHGIPPYQEAYNLKPPGIYLAYAAMMGVFGESPSGIHFGLLIVNLASAGLLYLITLKITSREGALSTTAAFLALTLMPKVLGLNAHATHFVLLPALGGIFLLQKFFGGDLPTPAASRARLLIFFSGILMGISALMKQPGVFFALFGALIVVRRWGSVFTDLSVYFTGIVLPVAASLVWLSMAGVFDRFWFWVVTYAISYGSEVGFAEGMDIASSVGGSILMPSLVICLLAVVGLAAMRGATAEKRYFVVALLITAILGVAMGFHFRRHYFVLMLPAVAVLFGLGVEWVADKISRNERYRRAAPAVVGVLAVLAIGQTFAAGSGIYFSSTPGEASRAMFGPNPFVESAWIADRVREMTSPGERIAVIGSEPQIYFYADRRPATGYIYMYGLVENRPIAERMRREMTAEIESRRPGVMVYVNNPSSWLLDDTSDRSIFRWLEGYVKREGYVPVGIVEIVSPAQTVSLLGDQARGYRPVGKNFIQLWKLAK